MGGLAKKMKTTTWTFVAGALSLSGFPLLAGFWSKDEIFGFAFEQGSMFYLLLGHLRHFLRLFICSGLYLLFLVENRAMTAEHAHESPKSMTIPLIVLAVLRQFAGYVGTPFISMKIQFWRIYKKRHACQEAAFNFIPMIISVVVGLSGILLAYLMYGKKVIPQDWFYRFTKPYHKILVNKYYIDEFYSMAIVRPGIKFAHLINWFDKNVIDGFINLTGKVTVAISKGVHLFDLGVIDGFVNWTAKETYNSGKRLRLLQTGNISGYAIVMFAVLAVYVIYMIIRTNLYIEDLNEEIFRTMDQFFKVQEALDGF